MDKRKTTEICMKWGLWHRQKGVERGLGAYSCWRMWKGKDFEGEHGKDFVSWEWLEEGKRLDNYYNTNKEFLWNGCFPFLKRSEVIKLFLKLRTGIPLDQDFSILALMKFRAGKLFVVSLWSVLCGLVSSSPGLSPLDGSSPQPESWQPKYLQTLSNIFWEGISLLAENHWLLTMAVQ